MICCDLAALSQQDFIDIDIIFTTVPIHTPVPVPVIETGFILDHDETNRIEKQIEDIHPMEKYFPKALFFTDLDLKSRDEVIKFLIRKIEKLYKLPDDFEEQIFKREQLFSTAFNNNVALPHPYIPCTDQTFAAVAILKEAIAWGDKPVQIIFLISLAKQKDQDIQTFYGKLSKVLVNDALLNQLIEQKSYDLLIEILNSLQV